MREDDEDGLVFDEELIAQWAAEYHNQHARGMPANPGGHPYGCACPRCVEFYRSLK